MNIVLGEDMVVIFYFREDSLAEDFEDRGGCVCETISFCCSAEQDLKDVPPPTFSTFFSAVDKAILFVF